MSTIQNNFLKKSCKFHVHIDWRQIISDKNSPSICNIICMNSFFVIIICFFLVTNNAIYFLQKEYQPLLIKKSKVKPIVWFF